MPSNKLLGAAALTAALAGGGLAGALLGVPAVSSAQDGTTTTEDTTATPDESTTPAPDSTNEGECGPVGHGRIFDPEVAAEALGVSVEDLKAALQDDQSIADVAEAQDVDLQTVIDALVADASADIDEAVADGRITEERAAELKAALPERVAELVQRSGFPGPGHPGMRMHIFLERLEVAAETIGISEADLRAALADGQSIAQVAEATKVEPQAVIDALVAEATAHIDEAVANGRIDEEKATELKAELPEHAADFVNREGLPEHRGPGGPGGPGGFGGPGGPEGSSFQPPQSSATA